MWIYQKTLEYPVRIKRTDPRMANAIIAQYGGPDGELGASLRYLSQRYTMPTDMARATLTDIGTEELAHMEMVSTMVVQLLRDATAEQVKAAGAEAYFVNHGAGAYPADATGMPFTAAYIQSKGEAITDLYEDAAAEQKARSTYEYLLRLADDPDVIDALRFLRQREIVHFQRFGELITALNDSTHSKCQF